MLHSIHNCILTIKIGCLFVLLVISNCIDAQSVQEYELNKNWKCKPVYTPKIDSGIINSKTNFNIDQWIPATVPGTVLTTMLNNKLISDPFYGLNNAMIPDLYAVGSSYYTYWFVNDFKENIPQNNGQVWLNFRGVNYCFKAYLNGIELSTQLEHGMFLRHTYNITPYLSKDGNNRLAVIVYPPDPAGNPNGGQGGDGTIAKNVTNQYVAGWDWIEAIPDRNTGIWDKVTIEKTGVLRITNPYVITSVKGTRQPWQTKQQPATLKISAEIENTSSHKIDGILRFVLDTATIQKKISIQPNTTASISLPDYIVNNPKLWWPNGYGQQPLYKAKLQVILLDSQVSDEKKLTFGIREIHGAWNKHTKSREVQVNGQKIFIKGGNWIASDAMLRLSAERYDAEIRMHRDMNLNLIRVWGGGITERPEFYDACDKYGFLVMQDFWLTGDCNGRWQDSFKKEDTLVRREYPLNHQLFIASVSDQIKMLRNHPSLAIWCGGNEIKPPKDILKSIKDTLLPKLDATRIFFASSNDDSMSLNSHDGPYTIQPTNYFFQSRSFPFNSEIGSVGIGDVASLQKFIPVQHFILPKYNTQTHSWDVDSVWQYHKYRSYDSSIEVYGHPKDIKDFCLKAQLVNFDQYRALMEGFTAHQWDWYTGTIIWKTQNPWTALTGQMYDCYLDPNACLYGLAEGAKNRHIFYNPILKSIMVENNNIAPAQTLKMSIKIIDMNGLNLYNKEKFIKPKTNTTEPFIAFKNVLDSFAKNDGTFLLLGLTDSANGYLIDENLYWLPNEAGNYTGLQKMPNAKIKTALRIIEPGIAEVTIDNPSDNPIAFFIRLALEDPKTRERILPVFYTNNYISILPGQQKSVLIEFKTQQGVVPWVSIEGWNVEKQYVAVKR